MSGEATRDGRNEDTVAGLLLRRLQAAGIDYFFANAGTDFPPIIEGFARAAETGTALPQPLLVPHENA
ncbi:MAG TPA: hypothetical protein VGP50_16115, partial [Stellaceae bacterium]|nr:hypothetical protein [Stellaceae bacterium]